MGILASLLGGGLVKSLENVALEAINTDKESAEAKSLYVQVLDPNGKMRRDIMKFVCRVYGFYLLNATVLIYAVVIGDSEASESALTLITATFLPITGLFGTLATASFGVNATNSWKDTKMGAS